MELREHLLELRSRLTKAVLAVLIGTVVGWFLYEPVFHALAKPMLDMQRDTGRRVEVNFTGVTSGFDLQLRISMFLGVIIASPVWIYQLWAFITPGLTKRERRYALGFMFSAVPLFLAGAALAYVALSNFVEFFVGFTPHDAANVISVDTYLDFVTRMILSFGLSFLLPVVLVALNFIGLLSAQRIVKSWRWVVVASFGFAAIASPTPDVTSMLVLAIPLVGLFGVAMGIAVVHDRRKERRMGAELNREVAAPTRIEAPESIESPAPVETD